MPFELKLDMARQCWDEARHCEISVKLGDWMGTEIGEFGEQVFLYEAACAPDPLLRLTGVNRALEGLAIDVFNTMREFGQVAGDPVLEFCEDWMLADEVTHVKMGSDWLRRLTENDTERRDQALEFQRTVDRLFSLGGFRGEEDDSPIRLARRFRELAGFDDKEIDEIAELSTRGRAAVMEQPWPSAAARDRQLTLARRHVSPETFTMVDFDAAEIAASVERLADQIGLGDAHVEVRHRRVGAARSGARRRPPIRSCSRSRAARWKTPSACVSSIEPSAPAHAWAGCCSRRGPARPGVRLAAGPRRAAVGAAGRVGHVRRRAGWPGSVTTRSGSAGSTRSATATASATAPTAAFERLWSGDGLDVGRDRGGSPTDADRLGAGSCSIAPP